MSVGNFKYQARKSGLVEVPPPTEERHLQALPFDWNHRVHLGPPIPDMLFLTLPRLGSSNFLNMTGPHAPEVERALISNRMWEVQGTNAGQAASSVGSVAFAVNGGIILTTNTTNDDQQLLFPLSDANVMVDGANAVTYNSPLVLTQWYAGRRPWFKTKIAITTVAGSIAIAGFKLTSTTVIATDNDGAYFRIVNGLIYYVVSNNNTDTATSTGITIADATDVELAIKVDDNMYPHFFVNGCEFKGVRLRDSQALQPTIGIQTTELASAIMKVRYADVSVDIA